ncbi:hypothetical protein B0J13DRAFT_185010 [Dactylonectria estremocensis]|uniref:Uncharacterized protein n=1 Tax=Dactylonectria estremocensis TaxID=1079267 RepID=A0A9P9FDQ8_9HYPO|nr:hypothetical protein B0J13DRAFT_185010 [Dactylonectria estremocensis]
MSVGWSAGDIVAAAQLLWSLYKALNEASGAPEHYRKSASTLRSIQFRLRYLSKVVGEDENPDLSTETEEASLLESADKDDIRYVVVSLKLVVRKLEALVAKGCDMKLDPNKKKRRRDWPMHQINKLCWYIHNVDEVDDLIQHMFELTAPLPDLYLKINTVLVKQQAVTLGVYHETELKYLKAILEKLTLMEKGSAQGQLLDMNKEEENKVRVPLLHAGPELGVPPAAAEADPGPDIGSALSHLRSVAHEMMSLGLQTRVKNLLADHYIKRVFTEWYSGTSSPRLWLYGDQAGTVSAIAYMAARDQRRPAIAFSGRHAAAGQLLTDQDRLFRMMYSLLFQLLQQFEGISILAVTGVDKPFTDLGLSMESMQLALKYMRYFLGLLPECVCIVDGWNFICNDAGPAVKQVLRGFLDLFEKPQANAADEDWYIRLLLTSPGSSSMLRDLGKDYVYSFDLKNHVGTGGKLHTTLLGMDW